MGSMSALNSRLQAQAFQVCLSNPSNTLTGLYCTDISQVTAKGILTQALIGICFLYSHGVIDGDIHVCNVLFVASNLDLYTVE